MTNKQNLEETIITKMNSMTEHLNKLAEELEEEELKNMGSLSPTEYKKLLLIYLSRQDLLCAKYLLERIADEMRNDLDVLTCATILRHWKIFEYGEALKLLNGFNWSNEIAPFVRIVYNRWYKHAINLIAKTFSSIKIENFVNMMCFTPEEILKFCKDNDWKIENDIIFPVRIIEEDDEQFTTDGNLKSLAQFMYFLETT